jgi:putative transposase
MLVVIDGAKALHRAVTEVFHRPVIQRCQLHKLRNVTDRLPDAWPRWWPSGCGLATATTTRWSPGPSWRRWPVSKTPPTPGAAASLREGLVEILTIARLSVPPTLARTLPAPTASRR